MAFLVSIELWWEFLSSLHIVGISVHPVVKTLMLSPA
jgi:hypothetical protein